jgi:hypothetical protein
MEHRLSATEPARSGGDILGRLRPRADSFLIERNGGIPGLRGAFPSH